jgi:hypothetical protein
MPNIEEYFSVATEGGRTYLVQATSVAHAAFRIEEQYQERVTYVSIENYDKIILLGDTNAPETPSVSETSNPESTGTACEPADPTEDSEGHIEGYGSCPQDIQD